MRVQYILVTIVLSNRMTVGSPGCTGQPSGLHLRRKYFLDGKCFYGWESGYRQFVASQYRG